MVEKPELLEHHADPAAQQRQFPAAHLGNILVKNVDEAAGGFQGEEQQPEQGCLARSRRPGEKAQGAGPQVKADILQNFGPIAVTQAHTVKTNH